MDLIPIELNAEERALLRWGLLDWGGPANPTEELARVVGFESVIELQEDKRRIAELIWTGEALDVQDWTRALVATEIVWASEVYGSGLDSRYTFGRTDLETVELLRSVQRKLLHARALRRPVLAKDE